MPASFNYNSEQCNIPRCDEAQFELLLCESHFNRYITDETTAKIQSLVWRRAKGLWGTKDKLKFTLFWLVHHLTNKRVPLSEHFPCESLFLYHLYSLRQSAKELSGEDDEARVQLETTVRHLKDDFQHPRNSLQPAVDLVVSVLDDTAGQLEEGDFQLGDYITSAVVAPPSLTRSIVIGLAVLIVTSRLVTHFASFEIQLPFNPNILEALGILPIFYAWSYFGSQYVHSTETLASAAASRSFYSDENRNRNFRALFRLVGARLREGVEGHGAFMGVVVGTFVVSIFFLNGLTWLEYLTSIVFGGIAWLGLGALVMIYPAYVDTGLIILRMPESDFNIDVYDLSGGLGISEMVRVVVSALWFNLAFVGLVVYVVVVAPEVGTNFIFLLVGGAYLFLRFRILLVIRKIIRNLENEAKSALESAKNELSEMPFPERRARSEHLETLSPSVLNLGRAKKYGRVFLVTVVIPVLVGLAQENWETVSEVARQTARILE